MIYQQLRYVVGYFFINSINHTFIQKISGEANEEQILTSALVYQDRPIMLTKVKDFGSH